MKKKFIKHIYKPNKLSKTVLAWKYCVKVELLFSKMLFPKILYNGTSFIYVKLFFLLKTKFEKLKHPYFKAHCFVV